MTIANLSAILKTDLDTAFSSRVTSLRTAKADGIVAAGVYQLPFDWDGVTSATASALLSQSFTVPDDDQELLVMGAKVSGDTGAYSLTLTGPLVSPISVSSTTTTNPDDITRYLPEANDEPLQVLLRGATYTLTLSTEVATGTNRVRAFLLMRNRPRRR